MISSHAVGLLCHLFKGSNSKDRKGNVFAWWCTQFISIPIHCICMRSWHQSISDKCEGKLSSWGNKILTSMEVQPNIAFIDGMIFVHFLTQCPNVYNILSWNNSCSPGHKVKRLNVFTSHSATDQFIHDQNHVYWPSTFSHTRNLTPCLVAFNVLTLKIYSITQQFRIQ